ncbi:MAG: hypothetical protein NTZ48_05260 [Candidatus Omnitrophica bacterium]|nr:hypothetical protein [Candidatus Omnitrophota bacterium]
MKTKINLIPKELLKKEGKFPSLSGVNQKLIVKAIIIIIVIKFATYASIVRMKSDVRRITGEINSYTQKISKIETSVKTDTTLKQEKIGNIRVLISEREKEIKDFGSVSGTALKENKFVYELLRLIAQYIPEEAWVEEMGFDKEKEEFYINGFSLTYPKIGTFLTKLGELNYLANLYMNNSEIVPEEIGNRSVIKFKASGKLNL